MKASMLGNCPEQLFRLSVTKLIFRLWEIQKQMNNEIVRYQLGLISPDNKQTLLEFIIGAPYSQPDDFDKQNNVLVRAGRNQRYS